MSKKSKKRKWLSEQEEVKLIKALNTKQILAYIEQNSFWPKKAASK